MGGGNVCSDGGGDEEEHLQGPRDDANGSGLHLHASHGSPHLRRRGSPATAAPGEALAPLAVQGGRPAARAGHAATCVHVFCNFEVFNLHGSYVFMDLRSPS